MSDGARLWRPVERKLKKLINDHRQMDSFFDGPVPCWLKLHDPSTQTFTMERINEGYEDATGISRAAYKGQDDRAVWLDKSAEVFRKNDLHVTKTRHTIQVEELCQNPQTGTAQYAVGWKWPYILRGTVRGVWGMANLWEKEYWESVRPTHPFYLKNPEALDQRWEDLYGNRPDFLGWT